MTPVRSPQSGVPAHTDPEVWAPRLARLLDDAIALYERLDELARRQADLIESGDHDALLGVLGERQGLVDRITAHAGDLDPFTSQWSTLEPTLPQQHRETLRPRLERLGELMRKIVERDEADHHRLAAMRDAAAKDLASIDRSQRATTAYSNQPSSKTATPRFQDRTG